MTPNPQRGECKNPFSFVLNLKPGRQVKMGIFSNGFVGPFLSNLIQLAIVQINDLEISEIQKSGVEEIEKEFIEKTKVEPILFFPEKRHRFPEKRVLSHYRPGVKGIEISIEFDFSGDERLWMYRPTISKIPSQGFPEAEVRGKTIVLKFFVIEDDIEGDKLQKGIVDAVQVIQANVEKLKEDVEHHNSRVEVEVKGAVSRRWLKAEKVKGAIDFLKIPLKQKDNPDIFVPLVVRKENPIVRASQKGASAFPEPAIEMAEYEHILKVIRSLSITMERNKGTFCRLGEEAIRDIILVILNGHYEGMATGETFNGNGKTDILIRSGDRNVFIAECKIWKGSKSFGKAIDQLLGYLTWRDCKCSLIVFNNKAKQEVVVNNVAETMRDHPFFKQDVNQKGPSNGESRFIFKKGSGSNGEILITTQVFHIPK